MSGQKEVLFLAHRIPYPPDKGDKIRSWHLFQHLTARFSVHLGCFVDDPDDLRHAGRLMAMTASAAFVPLRRETARIRSAVAILTGGPLGFSYYSDPRLRAYVRKVRAKPLAAEIAFSSTMAPYIEGARSPRIVDLCDADSEKWREYAEVSHGPMRLVYALEARRLARAETTVVNWADAALAVSQSEAAIFNSRQAVKRKVVVVGNGVDTEHFAPGIVEGRKAADVVFVGAMDYRANVDAALWFVREAWPLVRAAEPRATFAIVGSKPAPEVRALSCVDGVTVTGRVRDVRPFLAAAAAVVAPLRVARGVQNKLLEAMAMARPVVATPAANEGVAAKDGKEILIGDAPGEFAGQVCRLLADRAAGDAIGAAARAKMAQDFGWKRQLAKFEAVLAGVGAT